MIVVVLVGVIVAMRALRPFIAPALACLAFLSLMTPLARASRVGRSADGLDLRHPDKLPSGRCPVSRAGVSPVSKSRNQNQAGSRRGPRTSPDARTARLMDRDEPHGQRFAAPNGVIGRCRVARYSVRLSGAQPLKAVRPK